VVRRAFLLFLALLLGISIANAQTVRTLRQRVQQIVDRPQFRHSQFGIEIYDLATNNVLVAFNADKLFAPGSTTKLLTEGTALALLGPDYRFHTLVYRTGPVTPDGTLQGDLVLVAGGDPNLSARVRSDETLAFTNHDHSYAGYLAGTVLPGNPLVVLEQIAQQVAAHGIKRVQGRVLIDSSLFVADKAEPGTGAMISPIIVNDNVVDVTVTPAATEGGPTSILVSPLLPYLTVVNKSLTGKPISEAGLQFANEIANRDGTYTVTVEGNVPAGWQSALAAYKVKTPVRFAQFAFVTALNTVGIQAQEPLVAEQPDFSRLAASYTPENLVAEHISAPFKEELKVTLKASQNLHAATMPYFLGATLGHNSADALRAGFALEQQFLKKAGLDVSEASQADGVGGPGAAFTPDFMVHYLAYMARQPYANIFIDALPIMGRDGTLVDVQATSPAAGHVHAKSGTYVLTDALNRSSLLLSKALVGYIDTAGGHRLAFAAFVNQVPIAPSFDEVDKIGELLGEIASAAYATKLR
jgi:PBP4 family serine-type D-alanyl-D-alanine carboxypeptidase